MDAIIKEARSLINKGIWEPDELFNLLNQRFRKHYSVIRKAVHIAKAHY